MFPAWLITLGNFLFGWALKAWANRGPTPVVVEATELGASQQAAATDAASLKTETAIAQAEADAPKTQSATVTALSDGKF